MAGTIKHVVIVGGGTAGWITAGLLASEWNDAAHPVRISLVESPNIPNIGVGEGTWPSMRTTLQRMGISEVDFLAATGASFKQGTRFIGWATGEPEDSYYHPFSLPVDYATTNFAEYWLQQSPPLSFAEAVTPQVAVIRAGKAPKQPVTPEYAFNVNYAYHLDAGKFSRLLHGHVVGRLGVNYVSANVRQVLPGESGDIAGLQLDTGERLDGDLFIDCTGQRALLVGEYLGSQLASVSHQLANNRAIAVQVPYDSPACDINSTTHATACESGWIWDIGLSERRGLGYVYSANYTDEQRARDVLTHYIHGVSPGANIDGLAFRTIGFEPGYRPTPWVKNCVAVGLSAGFVEPLEASALALVEQAASFISRQLPRSRDLMDVVARRFNQKMRYHWERIVEFLKFHYAVSRRDDTDYWRDMRDPSSWPESLKDKLSIWQQQAPWHDDAPRVDELFPSASYQYVLYGMGFRPAWPGNTIKLSNEQLASLKSCSEKAKQLSAVLPTNRALLDAIHRRAA